MMFPMITLEIEAEMFSVYLRHNIIFKDVYREVGILEIFVTCLTRYANLLKTKEQEKEHSRGMFLLHVFVNLV